MEPVIPVIPTTQPPEEDALPKVGTGGLSIPDSNNNSPPLRFFPEEDYKDWSLDAIEVPRGDRIHLACPESSKGLVSKLHKPREECCVVAIAGAASARGKRSSVGIYHGKDNPKNFAVVRGADECNTSNIASLAALHHALKDLTIVQQEFEDEGRFLHLAVVKSDSQVLVRGLVDLIPKWHLTGFMDNRRLSIGHEEFFEPIDTLLQQLGSRGTVVKLWLVPKAQNANANRLARSALNHRD